VETSSINFYVMLESLATQKREAELREALAQSGWTTFSNTSTMETASRNTFQKLAINRRRHQGRAGFGERPAMNASNVPLG